MLWDQRKPDLDGELIVSNLTKRRPKSTFDTTSNISTAHEIRNFINPSGSTLASSTAENWGIGNMLSGSFASIKGEFGTGRMGNLREQTPLVLRDVVESAEPCPSLLFDKLSFQLSEGIMAVQGPSGAGKTTLLKCIAQLETVDSGEIFLNGVCHKECPIPYWRSRVLYVAQRPPAAASTPLEFWKNLRNFKSQNARTLYNPVEIAENWYLDPQIWKQDWTTLSGGESQRIALAMALALEPQVLLLDEPTSALDLETESAVEASICKFCGEKGKRALWITHDPEQANRVAGAGVINLDSLNVRRSRHPTGASSSNVILINQV